MTTQTLSPASSKLAAIGSTVAWTALGVGALFLAGKGITALGETLALPRGCWQLTGLRAAASATVVGSLVASQRGHLVLFGALYALVLPLSHSASSMLILSSALAGLVAWALQSRSSHRAVAILVTTLAFNAVLTLSGLVTATQKGLHERLGFVDYGTGLGLRLIATALIAGVFAFVLLRRPRHN